MFRLAKQTLILINQSKGCVAAIKVDSFSHKNMNQTPTVSIPTTKNNQQIILETVPDLY